jgi:hypothetical protein
MTARSSARMGVPSISSRQLQTSTICQAEAKHDTAFNPQETRPEEQKERAAEATKQDAVGIRLECSAHVIFFIADAHRLPASSRDRGGSASKAQDQQA